VTRQVPPEAVSLGALKAAADDREVEAVCKRCGNSLGHYWAGRRVSDGQVILAEPGTVTRLGSPAGYLYEPGSFTRTAKPGSPTPVRGPRTQAGVSIEEYAGRSYVRIRCGCWGSHPPKLSVERLAAKPVTIRPDGSLVVAL
jgi:hypothetical protein